MRSNYVKFQVSFLICLINKLSCLLISTPIYLSIVLDITLRINKEFNKELLKNGDNPYRKLNLHLMNRKNVKDVLIFLSKSNN